MTEIKPLFNPENLGLLRSLEGPRGKGLIDQMISMFCTDAPQQLDLMRSEAQKGHWTTVAELAKTMATTGRTLGTEAVVELCEDIIDSCSREPEKAPVEVAEYCRQMSTLLPATLEALQKEIQL